MGFNSVAANKYHYIEQINHVHTPGNSSGIVDGSAVVLVGSEAAIQAAVNDVSATERWTALVARIQM